MSNQIDVILDTKTKKEIKEPSRYKVLMLNDDHTPMDWVIDLLIKVFKHSHENAVNLTMTVHNEGSAVVGIYTYEIAEQKVVEAINVTRQRGFPLQLTLEEE